MPIPIGIVGLRFGGYLAETQLHTGCGAKLFSIKAVCDQDAERARYYGERFQARSYTDIAAMLADPSLQAVGLFSGPAGRAQLVRAAIRAGKDVITTKPFELDPLAAADVLAEAHTLRRVVHLNSPGPHLTPDLAQIAHWREEYQLGRPVAARGDAWHAGGLEEQADGSWYDDPIRCPVAPIFRIGIYLINDLVGLFGAPKMVQVLQSRLVTARPTADTAQLSIQFVSGAIATIFASLVVNDGEPYEGSLLLNFERGSIYRAVGPGRNRNGPFRLQLATRDADGSPIHCAVEVAEESGAYQWEAFHHAIVSGDRVGEVTAEHIVDGIKVIQAMACAAVSQANEAV